jgi:sulfotransferase family protein
VSPFFIVGNDRSGTTMLRLVLDRHPEVAIPPESMFLVDFAPVRREGDLTRAGATRAFAERVWSHPKVRLWNLPGGPPAVPEGLSHADAYRFAVEAPFRAYADLHGKSRWGDKTPLYLRHLDELWAVWPDARVVVLARDGRDVALSVIRLPFGANNVWTAARWWAGGVRLGREAARRRPEHVASLRYEDLVSRPADEVRRLTDFLGLGYDDDMLRIERTDRARIVQDQAGWFTNVWAGITTAPAGKWRKAMTRGQVEVFEQVAGAELIELGYELGTEPRGGGLPAVRGLGYAVHDTAVRGFNFVKLRLIQERGRELGYVVRRKLARR